jgi:hypothetical protein
MPFSLHDAVEMYASVAEEPFTSETVATAVRPLFASEPDLGHRILSLLNDSPVLFHRPEEDLFTPRASFFRGARFLVIPTAYELERSILVTGHRLIPYCARDICPSRAAILSPAGQKIRRKRITGFPSEVEDFLCLYGDDGLLDYLRVDSPQNVSALAGLDAENLEGTRIHFTVYWMKDAYEQMRFSPGDGLVFVVQDWREGAFAIEHAVAPMSPSTKQAREAWIAKMGQGFEKSTGCGAADLEERIARAVFNAEPFVREQPAFPVCEFVKSYSQHAA